MPDQPSRPNKPFENWISEAAWESRLNKHDDDGNGIDENSSMKRSSHSNSEKYHQPSSNQIYYKENHPKKPY